MHTLKTITYSLLGLALSLSAPVFAQTAPDSEASQSSLARAAVDINTADANSLAEALDGVGRSRAKSIIEWREANGPFEDPYDLVQVRGISERIVRLNESRIHIGGDQAQADE